MIGKFGSRMSECKKKEESKNSWLICSFNERLHAPSSHRQKCMCSHCAYGTMLRDAHMFQQKHGGQQTFLVGESCVSVRV